MGRGQSKEKSEAYVLKEYILTHSSIQNENIITEDYSLDTVENAIFGFMKLYQI